MSGLGTALQRAQAEAQAADAQAKMQELSTALGNAVAGGKPLKVDGSVVPELGIIGEVMADVVNRPVEIQSPVIESKAGKVVVSGKADLLGLVKIDTSVEFGVHLKSRKPRVALRCSTPSLGLGAFFPGMPLVKAVKIAGPTFIASTFDTLYDPGLDSGINKGVNFFGNVKFADSGDAIMKDIGKILGVRELALHAALTWGEKTPDEAAAANGKRLFPKWILEGAIQRDLPPLIKGKNFKVHFTRSDVSVEIKGTPPEPSITFSHDVVVTLTMFGKTNYLIFTGSSKLEPESITIALTLNGTYRGARGELAGIPENELDRGWDEPFGIKGVEIRSAAGQCGVSYAGALGIDNLGLHCAMKIGKREGSIGVLVDVNDPDQFVLDGELNKITIFEIMLAMVNPQLVAAYQALPGALRKQMETIVDVSLENVKLSIVPAPTSIGGIHYSSPGVTLAGTLVVFGWKASLSINVHYVEGLRVAGEMDGFQLAIRKVTVLKITGPSQPNAQLHLRLGPTTAPKFHIAAAVELLGARSSLEIELGDGGLLFRLSAGQGQSSMDLGCTFTGSRFSADGSMSFTLNLDTGPIRYRNVELVPNIPLKNVSLQASADIRTAVSKQVASFSMDIAGSFGYGGQRITMPALKITAQQQAPPRNLQAVHSLVTAQVKRNAEKMFRDVLMAGAKAASLVLQAAGYGAAEAANCLKKAGHAAADVGEALKSTYRTAVDDAAKLLKSAGYTADQVGTALRGTFTNSATTAAKALKAAGYTADQTGKALKGTFTSSATDAGKALKAAGFTAAQTAEVMKNTYGATAKTVQSFMKDTWKISDKAAKDVLKDAGFASSEVDKLFKGAGKEIKKTGKKVKKFFGL